MTQLTFEQAIARACRIREISDRTAALVALYRLAETETLREAVWQAAVSDEPAVFSIFAQDLAALAPHRVLDALDGALPALRADILWSLAPHLSGAQLERAIARAVRIGGEYARVRALTGLLAAVGRAGAAAAAGALGQRAWIEILTTLQTYPAGPHHDRHCVELIGLLAAQLGPGPWLADILPITRDLADAKERVRALITLAPLIGGEAGRACGGGRRGPSRHESCLAKGGRTRPPCP